MPAGTSDGERVERMECARYEAACKECLTEVLRREGMIYTGATTPLLLDATIDPDGRSHAHPDGEEPHRPRE